MGKGREESTSAMLGGSKLCEPHPTPMLSLLFPRLLELLVAQRQKKEIYTKEPVLSTSEADTPASLPPNLPTPRLFHDKPTVTLALTSPSYVYKKQRFQRAPALKAIVKEPQHRDALSAPTPATRRVPRPPGPPSPLRHQDS